MQIFPDRHRPLLFAHRGCSSLAPENTMAAFKKARDVKCPGIELDLHCSADGALVVAHDDDFFRTAEDKRLIKNLTLKEIKYIDVGTFFDSDFSGERVPLLEEVLEEFCPAMYIDIELKTRKIQNDPLPRLLAEKLSAFGEKIAQAVSISSFNPFALIAFKRRCPNIPTAIIWSADQDVPPILRYGFGRYIAPCDYLKPIHIQVNKNILNTGKPVIPWSVDNPFLTVKLLKEGCEGVISNKPQEIRAVC